METILTNEHKNSLAAGYCATSTARQKQKQWHKCNIQKKILQAFIRSALVSEKKSKCQMFAMTPTTTMDEWTKRNTCSYERLHLELE